MARREGVAARRTSASLLGAPMTALLIACSEDQAEGFQHATVLCIQFGPHRHQLMANPKHDPALMCDDAFGVHFAIPSHPQHVSKAARAAAVRSDSAACICHASTHTMSKPAAVSMEEPR
jgi:hypothetical protein